MKAKRVAVRDASGNLQVVELGGADEAHTHLWEDISDAPDKAKLIQTGDDGKLPADKLPTEVVQTGADGKIAASTLPNTVVQADADGKLPAVNLPGMAEGETPLVFGASDAQAGKFDRQSAAPTATDALRYNGFFRATRVYGMYYSDDADYAEAYNVKGEIAPGDLVAIKEGGRLERNTIRGNPAVIGIVSTAPASVIGYSGEHNVPIALVGRVPVWCAGKVRAGDFLMGSAVPGAVEKANAITERGAIVAQALEDKDDEGMRKIVALVVRL